MSGLGAHRDLVLLSLWGDREHWVDTGSWGAAQPGAWLQVGSGSHKSVWVTHAWKLG